MTHINPSFPAGSVPVLVASKVYGKDPNWVRAGIIQGWLPIGYATKAGQAVRRMEDQTSNSRINYYISPYKLWLDTGYIWKGE